MKYYLLNLASFMKQSSLKTTLSSLLFYLAAAGIIM